MINYTRFAFFDFYMSSRNSQFFFSVIFWSNLNWSTRFDCPIASHLYNILLTFSLFFIRTFKWQVEYRGFFLGFFFGMTTFCWKTFYRRPRTYCQLGTLTCQWYHMSCTCFSYKNVPCQNRVFCYQMLRFPFVVNKKSSGWLLWVCV